MSPIGPVSRRCDQPPTRNIHSSFAAAGWRTSVQNPLHLDGHSEPQPDLMLLKPAADYYRKPASAAGGGVFARGGFRYYFGTGPGGETTRLWTRRCC